MYDSTILIYMFMFYILIFLLYNFYADLRDYNINIIFR